MISDAPLVKIQMIKGSLRCFVCGFIGIVPVIGIPFAVVAFKEFRKVFFSRSTLWNPAELYLRAGLACATAGILLDLLIFGAVAIRLS